MSMQTLANIAIKMKQQGLCLIAVTPCDKHLSQQIGSRHCAAIECKGL